MTTHILFTDQLQLGSGKSFTIEPISKDWHLTCNNFKGTEQECYTQGLKAQAEANKLFNEPSAYVTPHHPKPAHESIFDY
jgi:hypothetical protein